MSIAVRADLVVHQSSIDAKGQTVSSVKTFGSGFTQVLHTPGNDTLVPAAAANTPDRLFLVCALGGHIWVSKTMTLPKNLGASLPTMVSCRSR